MLFHNDTLLVDFAPFGPKGARELYINPRKILKSL